MNSSIFTKIAIRQWRIFCIAGCLIAIAALRFMYYPIAQEVLLEIGKVYKNYSFVSKADSIAQMAEAAHGKADYLDSLIKTIIDTQSVSEQAVPEVVYSLANSAGIKASKVEISNKSLGPKGSRIPVIIKADGPYAGCGKFIEGIENMKPAGRILDLNLKSEGNDRINMSINFAILSQ